MGVRENNRVGKFEWEREEREKEQGSVKVSIRIDEVTGRIRRNGSEEE
jgi:hypothetical protein